MSRTRERKAASLIYRLLWHTPLGGIRLPTRGAPSLRARIFFGHAGQNGQMLRQILTLTGLKEYASEFLRALEELPLKELYGVTDGKPWAHS